MVIVTAALIAGVHQAGGIYASRVQQARRFQTAKSTLESAQVLIKAAEGNPSIPKRLVHQVEMHMVQLQRVCAHIEGGEGSSLLDAFESGVGGFADELLEVCNDLNSSLRLLTDVHCHVEHLEDTAKFSELGSETLDVSQVSVLNEAGNRFEQQMCALEVKINNFDSVLSNLLKMRGEDLPFLGGPADAFEYLPSPRSYQESCQRSETPDTAAPSDSTISISLDDSIEMDNDNESSVQVLERMANEGVQTAIDTYHPTKLCEHLRLARAVPAAVKNALPNQELVTDEGLKTAMEAVKAESDAYTEFITDFVRKTNTSTNGLKRLAGQVILLFDKGSQAIRNVHQNAEAWNYEAIKPQVDELEQSFKQIETLMKEEFDSLRDSLCNQRGRNMVRLQNMINGVENASAGFHAELDKQSDREAQQRRIVLQTESDVKYLILELKRMEAGAVSSHGMLEVAKANVQEYRKLEDNLEHAQVEKLHSLVKEHEERRQPVLKQLQSGKIKTDPQLEQLRRQAAAALQESAQLQLQVAVGLPEVEPRAHFVLILETSTSMSKDRKSMRLKQAVESLAQRRSASRMRGQRDIVSAITFDYNATLRLFNASWADLLHADLSSCSDTSGMGGTYYCAAWFRALDLVKKVKPPAGQKIRTIFVFVTDGVPTWDSSLRSAETHAQQAYITASANGNQCMGFTLLLGEQVHEHRLQKLVQNMNGGQDHILDESKQAHKLCLCARDSSDIMGKFDVIIQGSDTGAVARAKWRCSCDKMDKLQMLVDLRTKQMAEQESKTLQASMASMAGIDESHSQMKKRLQNSHAEMHAFYKDAREKSEQTCAELEEQIALTEGTIKDLQLQTECRQADFKVEQKKLKIIEDTDLDEFKATSKKSIEELRLKYKGFDPLLLNQILTYAKGHFENGQLLYDDVMESYKMAAEPVANMIAQLKQRNGSRINEVTGPRKVQQYYRQHGLKLGKSAADFIPNWSTIVKSICPQAADTDLKLFAETMSLNDFCFQESESNTKDDHDARLKQKFEDGLAATPQLKSSNTTKLGAEAQVKTSKDKVKGLEKDLQNARADPDRKDEIPDIKEDLKEANNDLKEAKKDLSDATLALRAELVEEFPGVVSIYKNVAVGVGEVFQSVLLANGMTDAQFSLERLYTLFGTTIKKYCMETKVVYASFLEDTAVVNPATATELCLQAISGDTRADLSTKCIQDSAQGKS